MTLAQHYLIQLPTTFLQRTLRYGVPYNPSELTAYTSITQRNRPASRPGPVFDDGSRGPTEWSHQYQQVRFPLYMGKYSHKANLKFEFELMTPGTPEQLGPTSLPGLPPPIPDSMVDRATNGALKKLRDSKVDLGVALAEAKQTAEFIARNTKRAADLLDNAYRRHPREWLRGVSQSARKGWKNLPNWYLENCYALNPLLSDIHGAAQALAESQVFGNKPRLRVTHEVSEEGIPEAPTHYPGSASFGRVTWEGTQIVKVGLVCDVDNWVLQEFDRLGLENPLSILWEKKAYSFVVDQFLPIGDWISAWDVSNYLRFHSGYITRFSFSKGVPEILPSQNAGPTWSLSEVREGSATRFYMSRELLHSIPRPQFPSLRNPLSLNFVASSMALLTQVVAKHRKLAMARFPFT